MGRDIATALAAGICVVTAAAPAQAQQRQFDIPAGSLKAALDAYGRQSGRPIIYRADEVRGATSPGYRGTASPPAALDALLSNSGFLVRRDRSGAVAIVRTPDAASLTGPGTVAVAPPDPDIVVTGTSIRGTNPRSAAPDVYTRADFDDLGVTSVDQLLRAIPQNLNSTGSVGANSIGRAVNPRDINAPDLRGLGPGATLSLLNGRRLPLANLGRGSDVSLIPLGAVARVEVLTDGASSIYGSDAVGGVINFILRDDFEGALTSASYGLRSDGGYSEIQLDQTGGVDWGSGGALVSLAFRSADALRGEELDFVGSRITTISPIDDRRSAFLSAHQNVTGRGRLFVDLLYSDRDTHSTTEEDEFSIFETRSSSTQVVGSAGLSTRLTDSLNFDLIGTYGHLDNVASFNDGVPGGPFRGSPSGFSSLEFTGKFDGTLFDLASNDVRFALGGGYLEQDLRTATRDLERATHYGFGELIVPLIAAGQNVPLVERLEVNFSARYTSTSDFGDSFDPRVGLYWKMNDWLAARGTWSRSFHAPELLQLVAPPQATIFLTPVNSIFGSFPDPFTPNRSTVYLSVADPTNPNLRPETSRSFTLGFDFTPPAVRNLRISATYYNIDYSGRIAFAPSIQEIAGDPELYAEFIRLPDRATIDALAARTRRVFDAGTGRISSGANSNVLAARATRLVFNGLTNLASQQTSGLDATIDYGRDFGGGLRMNAGAKVTWIFANDERATPNVPELRRLDTVSYPVSLRGRVHLGGTAGGWSGRLALNYVDSYSNTSVLPAAPIENWTTLDFVTSYRFDRPRAGLLGGTRIGLTVRNLLNNDPPFVAATDFGDGAINRIDYDAANHDPFGRLVMFSLTREW